MILYKKRNLNYIKYILTTKTMKTIYTVNGNHDGILGVYSNKKAAWESAVAYITQRDSENGIITNNALPFSYSKFCKKGYCSLEVSFKDDLNITMHGTMARIESYPLEKRFQSYPKFNI